jgi:hypothetical protein
MKALREFLVGSTGSKTHNRIRGAICVRVRIAPAERTWAAEGTIAMSEGIAGCFPATHSNFSARHPSGLISGILRSILTPQPKLEQKDSLFVRLMHI